MGIKEKPFRIGFIGAGTHARNMLYPSLNYIDFPEIERTAVSDLVSERAQLTAKQFGVERSYGSHIKMLEKEELDGVVVCINGEVHPGIVRDCLDADVDVFVEKPLALTAGECDEIADYADKAGRFVMIDHQKRRSLAYGRALDIARSPEFGRITMIETKMHGHEYDNLFNCMMEWQIHNIDIVRAFCGNVKNIDARMCRLAENRASIAVLLEFENGSVGTLNWGSEAGWGRFCERVEVVGSNHRGVIVENVRDVIEYYQDTSTEWAPNWIPVVESQTTNIDGYIGNLKHFIDCVKTRTEPVPNARDEAGALRVIYEICRQLKIPAEWTITIGKR